MDLIRGELAITGRDLTAELIDTKTSAKYTNLKSSQIVTKIAAAHGLTPVVTATSTPVGRYYQIDKVRLQDERSEWDLLTWLAREEQFDVFVKGQSLYFQPQASTDNPSRTFTFTPPTVPGASPRFDQQSIKLKRSLTLAKDITVTVSSWNSKSKRSFSKSATATHTKNKVLKDATSPTYDKQTYAYYIAHLTPDQAQQRAEQILADLTKHERKVEIEGPADNDLAVTDVFAVSGTQTSFDQAYHPDSIIRSYSLEDGYRWSITAKNHPAESDTTL
jgi:phage protein D